MSIEDNDELFEEIDDFDEEGSILVLSDEDGNEYNYEVIDAFEFEGKEYVVLLAYEITEEEVEIFELSTDENGEDQISQIEDEELLNRVFAEFQRREEEFSNEEDLQL